MLLYTNSFTHRCLYTGELFHRGIVTHRRAGTSTHRCLYTVMLLGRNAFSHMCFSTGIFLTQRILYTQKLSHRTTLTQRGLCTEIRLYRGAFQTQIVHRYFFLQRGLFWQILFHRDSLSHRCFGMLLGRWTFTWVRLDTQFKGGIKPFWNQASIHSHLYVYTQIMLLQRDAFTHTHTSAFTQGGAFTQRWFYTERQLY